MVFSHRHDDDTTDVLPSRCGSRLLFETLMVCNALAWAQQPTRQGTTAADGRGDDDGLGRLNTTTKAGSLCASGGRGTRVGWRACGTSVTNLCRARISHVVRHVLQRDTVSSVGRPAGGRVTEALNAHPRGIRNQCKSHDTHGCGSRAASLPAWPVNVDEEAATMSCVPWRAPLSHVPPRRRLALWGTTWPSAAAPARRVDAGRRPSRRLRYPRLQRSMTHQAPMQAWNASSHIEC